MSWVSTQLGDICGVVMGQAPDGAAYNSEGNGWPLIAGAGDFGELHPQPKKFTTEAQKLSAKGDIVLSIRASIGDKVWADDVYCLGRGVAALRPSNAVDRSFLWHWFGANRHVLESKAKGATFKQVNRSDIGELAISLPPLSEQYRIAEMLDRAEALRAQRRQALAQLDALAESIFLDMFGDPLVNPKMWPLRKLALLGTLDRGVSKHRPRNKPTLLGGPHPLIQTGDVANCDRYIRTFTATYSDAGLRQSRQWPAGTLCITIAANIAKTGILSFDACFPDSVVGFTPGELSTIEYVQTWLSFLQKMLEDSAPESAQKNINLAILRDLDVPLPPIELQRSYSARLAMVEQMKATQRLASEQLDALFASLQHRAFRGEL